MASITYNGVEKRYPDGTLALSSLDLEIADGEFLVFVGPSGCGKSTALRMTAGLEEITGGELLIDDHVVNHLQPQQRDIAMVFQDYALYPHMTVRQNLGFALRMMKLPKKEITHRVDETAQRLSLTALLDRKPKNLSGGQRQRVAMGRAIVREPAAFLMDEPLSNLDAKLRVQMRAEISALQRNLGTTTIYVTHDQVEAMTMGHRVAVLRAGVLNQVAPPEQLYEHPSNIFVAAFIGSPKMNIFRTNLRREPGGDTFIEVGATQIAVPKEAMADRPALADRPEGPIVVGIRPEGLRLATESATSTIDVIAEVVERLGSETLVHFPPPTPLIEDDRTRDLATEVAAALGDEDTDQPRHRMIARLTSTQRITEGDAIRLEIDPTALYFFDTSGEAIDR